MKAPVIPPESEKSFQSTVLRLASIYHWMSYHTWDSRRSQAGFPDLIMVRDGRVLAVELKSDKGKVTPEQKVWLDALSRAGIRCMVWRPRTPKQELVDTLQ